MDGCSSVLISEGCTLTVGHCIPDIRPTSTIAVRAAWNSCVSENSDTIYQVTSVPNAGGDDNPEPDIALIHLSTNSSGS